MTTGAPIQVTVSNPPRGGGSQAQNIFAAQSFRGSFAWGGSPGDATLVYIGSAPIATGALVALEVGNHFFAGVCISDVGRTSARGGNRELQFRDMREFLTWDYTFCAFNMVERRLVNGIWKKRWWHIYPNDYDTMTRTFTDAPLPAWEIVNAILLGPTIGTTWWWDFTGNGLFPTGLLNAPIYGFDALNGKRLDAALNEISAAGGLVYGLDPQQYNYYRLVWMRKGYGLFPVFPGNSDEQRYGVALSGNATNVRIIGDRNKYQVLNLGMQPDWQPAWEQFLGQVDGLAQDIFQNEKSVSEDTLGVPYQNFPDDPEQWKGRNAAKIRAMEITVAEYATLRDARISADGNSFRDPRKFSGRSRMDMPAALYVQNLVFRAYRPNFTGITNADGNMIPLESLIIADQMLCRISYDPTTGEMEDDPAILTDGNGLAIVKGWQFGQDFFKMVNPERITENMFSVNNRYWAASGFQIDDSLEGDRFIILDAPAFTAENLLTTINGLTVLNAQFTLNEAAVQAALVFEAERFSYWKGTWPNVSRDRAEYVSGLCRELSGQNGDYEELLYANSETASQQADTIAASLLLCQYYYVAGGYNLKWNSKLPGGGIGTPLSSLIDRVEIEAGPGGIVEIVDWTSERLRDYFEPERDLERRTQQNSLLPGQAELRQSAMDYKRFAAAIKAMPRETFDLFMRFLTGNFDDSNMVMAVINPVGEIASPLGGTIDAGTPFFKPPTENDTTSSSNTLVTYPPNMDPTVDTVFAGVAVRNGEDATKPFYIQTSGDAVARTQGPISENDPVGVNTNGYPDYGSNGAYFVKNNSNGVGIALQVIADSSIQLIKVRLNAGASGGSDPVWLP